ncbi:MAG: DUF2306 domain-containing protein [Bacteroidia bacterium]|nr:DUF2306 domain-containing protein [Bacteroidia bacterium]
MVKKAIRILLVVFAIFVGLYPVLYFVLDRKFALLATKSDTLLINPFWNIGFYAHIIAGGLALLIGWIQFNASIRRINPAFHKLMGKIYIIAVLFSSTSAFYIGFFATGGPVASMGFILLAIFWFVTTIMAYYNIRNGQIEAHKKLMIYSYAACFAAVTLRIWFPLLMLLIDDYNTAYVIVAWLCWVPNLFVAHVITRQPGIITT